MRNWSRSMSRKQAAGSRACAGCVSHRLSALASRVSRGGWSPWQSYSTSSVKDAALSAQEAVNARWQGNRVFFDDVACRCVSLSSPCLAFHPFRPLVCYVEIISGKRLAQTLGINTDFNRIKSRRHRPKSSPVLARGGSGPKFAQSCHSLPDLRPALRDSGQGLHDVGQD